MKAAIMRGHMDMDIEWVALLPTRKFEIINIAPSFLFAGARVD